MNAPLLIGGYGHVYVLSLEGGIVKVGKSARPKERIKSHGAGIGRFRRIEDHWISPSHLNYHENERALIEFLGVGGEVGEGDYAAVVEFASSLHFKVETQAEYQERRAHEQAAFEKMMSAFTSRCLGVKENEEPHMLMYLHAARTVRFVLESSGSWSSQFEVRTGAIWCEFEVALAKMMCGSGYEGIFGVFDMLSKDMDADILASVAKHNLAMGV